MYEKQSVERKENQGKCLDSSHDRKTFTKPKLTFIEPELTKHGDATKITAGFFGTFQPPSPP